MDVAPTSPLAAPTTTTGTESGSGSSMASITSDFDTFLLMLTTQIENQDPLNPMDSTEFATQLATFAGVEQQVMTNDLLRAMSSDPALAGLTAYSGWIGQEVAHQGPVAFDGTGVPLTLDLPAFSSDHRLVIATADGLGLGEMPIEGAPDALMWSGELPGGGRALPGDYMLQTVSTGPDGVPVYAPVASYAGVTEVRSGAAGVEIVLDTGYAVPATAVSAVRAP